MPPPREKSSRFTDPNWLTGNLCFSLGVLSLCVCGGMESLVGVGGGKKGVVVVVVEVEEDEEVCPELPPLRSSAGQM